MSMCGVGEKSCCICGNDGGCLAGMRDDYYCHASIKQVQDRLDKGEYKDYTNLMKKYIEKRMLLEELDRKYDGTISLFGSNILAGGCCVDGRMDKREKEFMEALIEKYKKEKIIYDDYIRAEVPDDVKERIHDGFKRMVDDINQKHIDFYKMKIKELKDYLSKYEGSDMVKVKYIRQILEEDQE